MTVVTANAAIVCRTGTRQRTFGESLSEVLKLAALLLFGATLSPELFATATRGALAFVVLALAMRTDRHHHLTGWRASRASHDEPSPVLERLKRQGKRSLDQIAWGVLSLRVQAVHGRSEQSVSFGGNRGGGSFSVIGEQLSLFNGLRMAVG